MIKRSELNRSLERELAAQEITLQKYREDRQRRDGKIAKQDKLLREYEKKMSEIGDTILELRDEAKLGGKRICVECAHVFRVNATGQRCTKCNRHKNVVTGEYISCDMARGVNIPDFEGHDDCGPEGNFWTPMEKQAKAFSDKEELMSVQKETIAAQRDTISALKEHIKSLKRNINCVVEDVIPEIPIVFNDTLMRDGGAG